MTDSRPYLLYARVSSDEQRDAETIKNQTAEVERYFQAHSIPFAEWFLDDGVTGTTPFDERPAGAHLLAALRTGQYRGLACLNHKRLGRDAYVIHLLVRQIERELGLDILAVREPVPREMNPGARALMRAVYAGAAEADREDFLANSREGMERAAREGRWCGGPAPFGYHVETVRVTGSHTEKHLAVNEAQAEVVREAFNLYTLRGLNMRAIALEFNARNYPHPLCWPPYTYRRARPWYPATICRILRSRVYIGEWAWRKTSGRVKKKGSHKVTLNPQEKQIIQAVPAIITLEQFREAEAVRKKNFNEAARNSRRLYLLRGLIKCGLCGSSYTGAGGGDYNLARGHRAYYMCSSYVRRGYVEKCANKYIRADRIENLIWQHCVEYIRHPGNALKELRAIIKSQKKERPASDKEFRRLEGALSVKSQERAKVIGLIRRGKITETEGDRELSTLQSEVRMLESERERLITLERSAQDTEQRLTSVEEMLIRLDKRIVDASPQVKREIMALLVGRVTLTPETLEGKRKLNVSVRFSFSRPDEHVGYVEGSPPPSINSVVPSGIVTSAASPCPTSRKSTRNLPSGRSALNGWARIINSMMIKAVAVTRGLAHATVFS